MSEHRVLEDDVFRIISTSSVATVMVARITVLFDDGQNVEYEVTHTSAADRSVATDDFGLIGSNPGRVVRAVVAGVTAIKRGQCYVELATVREGRTMDILAQDYLHSNNALVLDRYVGPLEGPGFIRVISLGDPAAGSDYVAEPVPTNALWKLRGISGSLACDANAASRYPVLQITDGTNVYAGGTPDDVATANETRRILGTRGAVSAVSATGFDMMIPIPEVLMPETHEVQVVTAGIQVGDDWGEGFISVEEWIAV